MTEATGFSGLKMPRLYGQALFIAVLALCPLLVQADWYSETQGIMGTEVSVTLWHTDQAKAESAIAAVMVEMRRIDEALSPYKSSSELSKINQHASKSAQKLSPELALLLDKSLYFSRISNGAFDISFASLAQFYDYRAGIKPNKKQIQEFKKLINYSLLDFNKQAQTLFYKSPKLKIDLGGIAKGYAVDRGIQVLKEVGIKHASISAGGDSYLLGDRRGRPWIVGIKHPRQAEGKNKAVIRLPLEDTAISTSGDYERYFIDEQSGERIHHIIDPKTGRSASDVISVTVLGPQGVDADPLSTTLFILGVEQALQLVNRLPGFDAVIIDADGVVHYSEDLAAE
ncbi:FAD:protein FMN transferase [Agaribacterium sp. ZY112]|uniref:FAD:protein FMN transferase n=1 Tax=Agaribacterium sp. ZY112 TaxID=3233574 RepID=UPI00352562B7